MTHTRQIAIYNCFHVDRIGITDKREAVRGRRDSEGETKMNNYRGKEDRNVRERESKGCAHRQCDPISLKTYTTCAISILTDQAIVQSCDVGKN